MRLRVSVAFTDALPALSRNEISELIMHMAIYGGFPVAVEAMRIAREVFDQRDAG